MSDYNGWTNYETWNVALWTDNDEGIYNEKMRIIRRAWRPIEANDVEQFFHIYMNDSTPDLDQLRENGEAIDPVNFDEIAEHWEEERQEMEAA